MTKQEVLLYTEEELSQEIGELIKARRIRLNMRQKDLANKAGIALPTYIVFESTGKISLVRLLKVLRHVGLLGDVVSDILNSESIDSLGAENYIKTQVAREKSRVFQARKTTPSTFKPRYAVKKSSSIPSEKKS